MLINYTLLLVFVWMLNKTEMDKGDIIFFVMCWAVGGIVASLALLFWVG